jgi:hypothetical protein
VLQLASLFQYVIISLIFKIGVNFELSDLCTFKCVTCPLGSSLDADNVDVVCSSGVF